MLQLYNNVIEGYNFMHVHNLWLFGNHVIHVVTSIQSISTSRLAGNIHNVPQM